MKTIHIRVKDRTVALLFALLLVLSGSIASGAVSGTVSRWVGNILTFDGNSGSNAFTFDTNGLRGDFGLGNDDYIDSDGTNLQMATTLEMNGSDDGIDFNNSSAPSYNQGEVFYCAGEDQSLCYYNDEVDVTMNIGQEDWIRVFNATGSTIANGAAVYVNGRDATSGLPTVALADADTAATAEFAGVATHSIENATKGYITAFGMVNTFDTSALSAGLPVYVSSTAGALTSTIPASPAFKVQVGVCIRSDAAAGKLFVQPGVKYTAEGTSAPTGAWPVEFIGLVAESANGQGAFFATGSGTTAAKFRNIVCTCRVTGTGGTNGIFAEIFAGGVAGTNCELVGGDTNACDDTAGTVLKCDVNTSIVASTSYTLQIKSTTDCATNPTDCGCSVVIER